MEAEIRLTGYYMSGFYVSPPKHISELINSQLKGYMKTKTQMCKRNLKFEAAVDISEAIYSHRV